MRYLSFKILVLCVFLPPFLYVFSVKFIETSLKQRYENQLKVIAVGDTGVLFNGNAQLQDVVNRNVKKFLLKKKFQEFGVKITITISLKRGHVLYPAVFEIDKAEYMNFDAIATARNNYRYLNEGLNYQVIVKIEHNSTAANIILLFFVALAVVILQVFYRRGLKKAGKEDHEKINEILRLKAAKEGSRANLAALEVEHDNLTIQLDKMRNSLSEERKKARNTEDEMVEELVALEEKINNSVMLYEKQGIEIAELKQTISQFEKEKKREKRQVLKMTDIAKKRLTALYKNTVFKSYAVSGFAGLTEEMKLKAEAIIHQLNNDAKKVSIKRKVFGKKNRETVFEINFAYKGRLYFRNLKNNRIEILAIGTKHTQLKDLAFLDKL